MKTIYLLLITSISILFSGIGFGQISINNAPTPANLVLNNLAGNGVTISNITYVGHQDQIGSFMAGTSNIGLPSGVVMSSGNVSNANPSSFPSTDYSNPGDPDLLLTAQSVTSNPSSPFISSTYDAAVLEFDFIPVGDTVKFNFVFTSEEYTTYINTIFNDAFGFYLNGPNPAGGNYSGTNLALVPGTSSPITISTIHPGLNAAYYIGTPIGHSYNGFTIPITIKFAVICNETYHFKFAIADCEDGTFDSGVFLEGGSFSSNTIQLQTNSSNLGSFADTLLSEGCTSTTLQFIRPTADNISEDTISLVLSGTVNPLLDLVGFNDTIIFPIGVDTVTLVINPINDGISEGQEFIEIGFYNVTPCGDSIYIFQRLYIVDRYPMTWDLVDTVRTICVQTETQATVLNFANSIPPFAINWDFGSSTNPSTIPNSLNPHDTINYYVTLTDGCGNFFYDSTTLIINQSLQIDSILMLTPATCDPVGSVTAMNYPYGGTLGTPGNPNSYSFFFDWTYQSDTNIVWPHQSSLQDLPGGWYVLELTDNIINCTVIDSVFVETINVPMAQGSVSPSSGCSPVEAIFSNASQNATDYTWDFGNGNVVNTASTSNITQTYTQNTTIMLVASNGYVPCNDTTYMSVQIVICGCTDPTALNYNPTAAVNDGSCVFPIPTVTAPNVLTLNGDDVNGVFFLKTTNAENIELTIVNRWGTAIYEGTGDQANPPMWNGTDKAGNVVGDGVFFYRFKVTGLVGEPLEGHGFITVVR